MPKERFSRSPSRSRSPSPATCGNAIDKTELKAIKEASKNALFNFKGKTHEDLQTWIYTMESYLSLFHLHPLDEMKIATAYLKENALQKFICHPYKHKMTLERSEKVINSNL